VRQRDEQPIANTRGTSDGVAKGVNTVDPVTGLAGPGHPGGTVSTKRAVSVDPVDFDGYRAILAKHRGKVVVVDLWATWCIPCVQNFPHLVEMHRKYAERGVACVSLSLDNLGSEETSVEKKLPAVHQFLIDQHATFDNLISVLPFDEISAADKLGIGQIPAVFVLNKEGEQVRVLTPGPDLAPAKMYEEVEAIVVQLLEQDGK
jgi:thiol-disulfide isomerase/thioredoxin